MTLSLSIRQPAFSLWLIPLLALWAEASPQPTCIECRKALYRGEFRETAQLAQRYLQQHTNDVDAWVLLARAELAQGKFVPAFEDLRKALAIKPHDIDALYYLSFTARALADQEYQRLYSMAPDSSRVHQLLAEAALQAQNPTLAEREFQKALAAGSPSAEVFTELAELKRSQSKFDEAITYYTKAAETGSLNYDIAYGLGACYTYKQDYEKATEWLRRAVAMSSESVAGHFALGNALFQSGAMEAAIPELQTAVRLEPRMKQAYFLLGRAYTKLGRKDEAAGAFKKLDELSGSTAPAPNHQGSSESDSSSSPR